MFRLMSLKQLYCCVQHSIAVCLLTHCLCWWVVVFSVEMYASLRSLPFFFLHIIYDVFSKVNLSAEELLININKHFLSFPCTMNFLQTHSLAHSPSLFLYVSFSGGKTNKHLNFMTFIASLSFFLLRFFAHNYLMTEQRLQFYNNTK